jgi:hypothetical protein
MSYGSIISWMEKLSSTELDFKIVPQGSNFVIGSNSKNEPGDYYIFDEYNAIEKPDNRLNKRLFDLGAALLLLLTLPLNIWFMRHFGQYLGNIFSVLGGKKSWVGYSRSSPGQKLPPLKTGVLNPADEVSPQGLDTQALRRLDYLYAKDYTIFRDIAIFMKGFSRLDR